MGSEYPLTTPNSSPAPDSPNQTGKSSTPLSDAPIAPLLESAAPAPLPTLTPPVVQPQQQPGSAIGQTPPVTSSHFSSTPSAAVVMGGPTGPTGTPARRLSRKTSIMLAGATTAVLLAGAAYTFAYYIPNKPENVYATAMQRTGMGYDKLTEYLDGSTWKDIGTSSQVEGNFKLKSAGFATDGTFGMSQSGQDSTFNMDVGMVTSRIKLEGISKDAANSESPDVYLKASGIKGYGQQLGLPGLDTLDNQWIAVDHTLLDTYAKDLTGKDSIKTPDAKDLAEVYKTVGNVSDQYLFTANADKQVVEMRSYVGRETTDGKDAFHYKVGVDKENLKAYAKALATELDKTKLNDWAKANYEENISQLMAVDDLVKSVDSLKDGDTADLWVNAKTKLVQKVRFANTNNAKAYTEVGLDYDKGDIYPFFIRYHDGQSDAEFTVSLNTKTDNIVMNGTFKSGTGDSATSGSLDFTVTPKTDSKVAATAPTGAISINEALSRIGLGDSLDMFSGMLQATGTGGPSTSLESTELDLGTQPDLESLYNIQ